MATVPVTREQILSFRRLTNGLGERRVITDASFRRAAWAGLQDSMPRAGVLSLHARLHGVSHDAWADPAFVQVWGPRFSVFVVPAQDRAVFTVGRHPEGAKGQARAEKMLGLLQRALQPGEELEYNTAGKALDVDPNALRYATTTGAIVLTWDGARRPTLRLVDRPDTQPEAARLELARRHLRVFGPASPESFSEWAGVGLRSAIRVFEELVDELAPVRTPEGDAWLLAEDEELMLRVPEPTTGVRLLPSGDAYYLLQGRQRDLLVPDSKRHDRLWTPRVWPGALLVDGEIAGVWRRSKRKFTIEPWLNLSPKERDAVEAEAESLPLPDQGETRVAWDG